MSDVSCPVVVLLGAGASKDANLLLSVDLTNALIDSIEKDNNPDLRRALGLILGGILLQHGVDGELQEMESTPDIETVLRVAQQLERRTRHPLAGYVSAWVGALERLAPGGDGTVFRSLHSHALEVMKDKLRTPEDPIQVKYLSGVCHLGRPWCEPGDQSLYPEVFTLNYDLCLEAALRYERFPYTTGFDHGLWTQSCFDQADRVRIYKLHGSFRWVRDPEKQLLYDRDAALGRSDVTFLSEDIPDEIVFATENKMQALQPYLWLVHRFSEGVTSAKYVVVVGYSFSDEYINQILGQAMALDPTKRLIVVSPHFDPAQIERTKEMTYYAERILPIKEGAKQALYEQDSILKTIVQLEEETRVEAPF